MTQLFSAIIGFLVAIGTYFFYDAYVAQAPVSSPIESDTGAPQPTETLAPTPTTLDRSGRNLTEMPKEILGMTYLQKLDLSNNLLTGALPAEIRHLSNLEVLNVSDNKMTGLPAELGQLSKLRVLNVANNQLTGIPHELGNLQNLEVLDLSDNNISQQDLDIIRNRLPTSAKIII